MSVVSKLENFFKSVGAHVKSAFISIFGAQTGAALTTAAEQWAKTQLGQVAITVVHGLEAAALSPADKQRQAMTEIGSQLAAQGKSVPSSLINFAIEFALQVVRGGAAALPAPTA
jgi:hypothetical protein